jgi:hypothetical protein
MTNPTNPANNGHGDYERRDIGVGSVLYFLLGLALFLLISHFVVDAVFHYLEKRSNAQQAPVSPMVTNAPVDTRKLPTDYREYLKQNFPSPQLEVDERTQLDKIRLDEEEKLSAYDYVDKQTGTIRIPIERAMDLIAQRGLPVRNQAQEKEKKK